MQNGYKKVSDRILRTLVPPEGRTSINVPLSKGLSFKAISYDYKGETKVTRSYILRYTLNGKKYNQSLGKVEDYTIAEVREVAERCLEIVDKYKVKPSDYMQMEELNQSAKTLEDLIETFFEHRKNLAQNTVETYRRSAKVLASLYGQPINELKVADFSEILLEVGHDRPGLSRYVCVFIKTLFNFAVSIGLLESHPFNRLREMQYTPKHFKTIPMKDYQTEIADVFEVFASKDIHRVKALFVALGFFTLLRPAEVQSLRIEDMNLTEKYIWCRKTKTLKNGFNVPLTAPMIALLEVIRDGRKEGEFFPTIKVRNLAVFLRNHKVPFNLHGWRAAGASWMVRNKISLHIADACLSHKIGDKVTLAYVRGDLLEERREAMEQWHRFLCGVFANTKNLEFLSKYQ